MMGNVLFLSVEPPVESSALWSMEKMKAYFSVIKRLQPQVTEQAKWILTRYYQLQRQRDDRNAARTTIRMLESLSRLAEGGDGGPHLINSHSGILDVLGSSGSVFAADKIVL